MANEGQARVGFTIRTGNLNHRPPQEVFNFNVDGEAKGPTPGGITVPTSGVNVDLSQLDVPGVCMIKNLSADHAVEYGPYDESLELFLPFGEALPGEAWPVRLSRFLGREMGTGTGTGAVGNATAFRIKAIGGTANVLVEAFEA